jgi:hypothetical protein
MDKATLGKSIAEIISDSSGSMDYGEIASKLAENGKIAAFGAMPYKSVSAIIEDAILKDGDDCPFVKTYPGAYILGKNARPEHLRAAKALSSDLPDPLGIITCYGKLWNRYDVNLMPSAQIMGCQIPASPKVNFAEQAGIYALHLNNETVTYIGQTGERTLGECLFDHTRGRMNGLFEKFSFYGFRPVLDDGTFGSLPEKADIQEVMASMLSALVEVANPKANRRYFDKFSQLEFEQWPDPKTEAMREIEKIIAQL